jgi:hypothetical protein
LKRELFTMMFTATNQPHNLGIHGNLIWIIQFSVHSEIAVEPNVTFMLNLFTTFSCNLFFSWFFSCQIAYLKIIFQSKMYKCLHLKFFECALNWACPLEPPLVRVQPLVLVI